LEKDPVQPPGTAESGESHPKMPRPREAVARAGFSHGRGALTRAPGSVSAADSGGGTEALLGLGRPGPGEAEQTRTNSSREKPIIGKEKGRSLVWGAAAGGGGGSSPDHGPLHRRQDGHRELSRERVGGTGRRAGGECVIQVGLAVCSAPGRGRGGHVRQVGF